MKDGGPAFPAIAEGGPNSGLNSEFHYGMSLRDYFAAAALPYIIQCQATAEGYERPTNTGLVAAWAYEIADAMLKERERT